MSAAEVLAQHRRSWTVQSGVASCTAPGCDWGKFGTLTQTDEPFAQHQLDALKAAGYEIFHVTGECAHCGEPIKWEPDFKLWFHPSSGIEHCYRAPEHTEVATPKHVATEAGR